MQKIRIFLASSSELKEDRLQFEIFINRKNKAWHDKGVFIHLDVWEDFLDALSQTRLQEEYNKAIQECDIFVMLFFTKVGKYTKEEFKTAFGQFKKTNKPFIFTYFKDAAITIGSANQKDLDSLRAFQNELGYLGHFYTVYKNADQLKHKFGDQLDKLADSDFIELVNQTKDHNEISVNKAGIYSSNLSKMNEKNESLPKQQTGNTVSSKGNDNIIIMGVDGSVISINKTNGNESNG
jgi:hypothetical protein